MLGDYLQLIRFDKPIGSLLLLWPTWWGLWLACHGLPPFSLLLVFSLGVFLTRAAGCAINDVADSKFDGQVERTAKRPLVSGRITKKAALLVSAGLSLLAFVVAGVGLKSTTLIWSLPALFLLLSYPFFKRFFPLPQLYLGIAFSFGIPMAFVECSAALPLVAWELFVANCLWVVAYDTIYALVDIDDDRKLGLKTSAITFGNLVIPLIMLCYGCFIGLLFLIGIQLKLPAVFFILMALTLVLVCRIYCQIKDLQREKCFQAFLANNKIGALIFLALAVSMW